MAEPRFKAYWGVHPKAPRAGRRVRSLREAQGLSLRDLSERCGVSVPMLSQVERGETSPTLVVAGKIAAGLGLSLSQLLRLDEGQDVVIVRSGEGRRIDRDGHHYEELSPALPGERAAVSAHNLKPGSRTGAGGHRPVHAPGSREIAVVRRGRVTLVLAGAPYELGEGDSVTFDADLPHHFENAGRGEASFVAVVTSGLRQL